MTSAPAGWLPPVLPFPHLTGTLLNLAAWTAAAYGVLKAVQYLARTFTQRTAPSPRPTVWP